MAGEWRINVKGFTGNVLSLAVANPQEATVLDLKRLIYSKQSEALPYLQRLVYMSPGGARTVLEDNRKLSAYPNITHGCTLFLVQLTKYDLYVHDAKGNLHSLTVPSSEPDNYSIAELVCLFEDKVGQRMDEHQFQFKGKPLEMSCHGKQLTLKTYGITRGDTLFVMQIGFTLDITNPQVDLCFLVDCTGSMSGSIEAVKNNIKQLRDGLDAQYKGCDLKFAFVRYTDYDQPESTRTTWIDFTNSQSAFHSFVSAISAGGGGDAPEDIMGGLKAVFTRLNWRADSTKVLIHIADCPCHGTQYHDHASGDSYPNGDPSGITHDHMMEKVAEREVQYWFGYINKSSTDKMISVFNSSLRRYSNNRMLIRQFEALQSHEVREGVHKAVTASVYASKLAKKASIRSYTLDSSVPNWTTICEQFARKTLPPGILTLRHLQEGLVLQNPTVQISLKLAPRPFAEGEESIVFRGYDVTNRREVVLKQSRREAKEYNSLEYFMSVLNIHTVAATYAREFNSEKAKPPSTNCIEFLPLDVVQYTNGVCYMMEPYVLGKFEKFNNNQGVVCSESPVSSVMQAFSHYTWEKSGGSLLVCDLEGVPNGTKVQLTDPAIHSQYGASKYGETDLRAAGIQMFFKTHSCNDVCRAMSLKRP